MPSGEALTSLAEEAFSFNNVESLEVQSKREQELTVCTILIPGKGYLCRVEESDKEGAPTIVSPIQAMHASRLSDGANFYDVSNDLLAAELGAIFGDKDSAVPMLRSHKNISLAVSNQQGGVEMINGVNVYDILCDDPKVIESLEADPRFTFVPESMVDPKMVRAMERLGEDPRPFLDSQKIEVEKDGQTFVRVGETQIPDLVSIEIAGKKRDVYIHPDCMFLHNEQPRPYEITGNESMSFLRKVAREALTRLESIEGSLETSHDRLTLVHIDRLKTVITNEKLAGDLETAYISERIVAISLQHLGTTITEGGILYTIANEQDTLSLLALGGALVNGLAIESFAGKTTKVSFGDLLNKSLLDIKRNHPSLEKADIEGMTGFESLAPVMSRRLSDAEAMKSAVLDKWLPMAANTVIVATNAPVEIAAGYFAASAATNIFESVYRNKLRSNVEKDVSTTEEDQKQDSKIKTIGKKVITPLIKASGKLAPALVTRIPFSASQGLELGVTLAGFFASHDVNRVSKVEASAKRASSVGKFEKILDWVENDAVELNTDFQYLTYCKQKAAVIEKQLSREELVLPDVDPLGLEGIKSISHTPAEVQTLNGRKLYPILDRAFGGLDSSEKEKTERRRQESELFDQMRKTAPQMSEKEFIQKLTSIRATLERPNNGGVVFCGLTVDVPGEKVLLHGASFVAPVGKIVSLGGEGINTPILESLAEKRKAVEGTTYIRSKKGDTNVHLDENRSELLYCDCKVAEGQEFFSNQDQAKIMEFITSSNLFTPYEVSRIKRFIETGVPITRFSRGSGAKLAMAQAFYSDSSVIILDHTFSNILTLKDEELITDFLDNMSNEKAIILREDTSKEHFRRTLARKGKLTSYTIEDRKLRQADATADTIVFDLERVGIGTDWSEKDKKRLASEIVRGVAHVEFENGEPIRKTNVARANIYVDAPNDEKYKLVQVKKIEPTSTGGTKIIDRADEPYSLYRTIESGNAQATVERRLREMGVDISNLTQSEFVKVTDPVRKTSASYPNLLTEYSYSDTEIILPVTFMEQNPDEVYAYHKSGGFTQFTWERVSTE